MREILFRGKRLDTGDWVQGYLIDTEIGVCIHSPDMFYETLTFLGGEEFSTKMELVRVAPKTVCQYTGLTDKNETKIFENHIVKVGLDYYVIKYCIDQASYSFFTKNGYRQAGLCADTLKLSKVVGNIFDNFELLK